MHKSAKKILSHNQTYLPLGKEFSCPWKLQLFNIYSALYILGNIKVAQGKLDEALQLHQEALKTREKTLGDHYQTAASFHKTGDILQAIGKAGAM
jgi:tetratricopeptide (TPR) repeat protein